MSRSLNRSRAGLALAFFGATVITRVPFASRFFFDFDEIQFALGTRAFDVRLHQPHPPGYFLFVLLGRGVNALTGDPHTSFLLINILASGAAVAVIYLLGCLLQGEAVGRLAGLLALTSPVLWFHGEIGMSYVVECLASTLVAYTCWRVVQEDRAGRPSQACRWVWLGAVLLGLTGGLRQGAPLLLFPLWLWAAWRVPWKARVGGLALGALALASWLGPMLIAAGGWNVYYAAVQDLWARHHGQQSLFKIGPRALILHVPLLMKFIFWATGPALLSPLLALGVGRRSGEESLCKHPRGPFLGLWIGPSLVFYAVTLVLPFNHGEVLIVLPGLVLGIACSLQAAITYGARQAQSVDRWLRGMYRALPTLLAGANVVFFLILPSPVSVSALTVQRQALEALSAGLRTHFDPRDTVLLAPIEFRYLSYRHAMYYLPEYQTYLARPTPLHEGVRYFGGRFGQTELRSRIGLPPGTRNIVCLTTLWPLPGRPTEVPVLTLENGLPLPYFTVDRVLEMYPDCEFEWEGQDPASLAAGEKFPSTQP